MNRWDVTFGIAFALLLCFLVYRINHDNQPTDACIDAGKHWIDIGQLNLRCK